MAKCLCVILCQASTRASRLGVSVRLGTSMGASGSTQRAGAKLKELRKRLGLTLRGVESASKSLAEKKCNYDFFISRAWLNSVENGEYTPGPCKLYTLGAIYRTHWTNLFAFYGL